MNEMAPVNPQIEERQSPPFFSKYKFTIISLCVILIALIPLLLLAKNKKAQQPTIATLQPTTTPTPIPLTQQNAQPTISATDQQIQNALTQSNQDINSVNQVDSSQDSVAGL